MTHRFTVPPDKACEILKIAFNRGAIVVCDEISSASIPQDLLACYLSGEDENGARPERPGFTFIGSANGIHLHGRKQLPTEINDHLLVRLLKEYSDEERVEILQQQIAQRQKRQAEDHEPYLFQFFVRDRIEQEQRNNSGNLNFRSLQHDLPKTFENLTIKAVRTTSTGIEIDVMKPSGQIEIIQIYEQDRMRAVKDRPGKGIPKRKSSVEEEAKLRCVKHKGSIALALGGIALIGGSLTVAILTYMEVGKLGMLTLAVAPTIIYVSSALAFVISFILVIYAARRIYRKEADFEEGASGLASSDLSKDEEWKCEAKNDGGDIDETRARTLSRFSVLKTKEDDAKETDPDPSNKSAAYSY